MLSHQDLLPSAQHRLLRWPWHQRLPPRSYHQRLLPSSQHRLLRWLRLWAGHPGLLLRACHQQLPVQAVPQGLPVLPQLRWAVEGLGRSVHGF